MVAAGGLLDALIANLWARAATALAVVTIGYLWTRREQMQAALTTPIHARQTRLLPELVWIAYAFVYGWLGDAHIGAVFAAAAGSSLAIANALERRSVRKQLRAAPSRC
jgi:hypothetical protein